MVASFVDADTTVAVQHGAGPRAGMRYLRVAGKVDASSGPDMGTQLLLAHLPLLLSTDPREVLVIGLGSGVTAGAALTHPIRSLDVVEISRAMVAASLHFGGVNRRFWEDRRARVVVDDARHHLARSRKVYDVIISEPSNPWMAGIGNLYTREFFDLAARRLAPDGAFCQWIHTYEMDRQVLSLVLRTFLERFPHVHGFVTGHGSDLLLVGRRTRWPLGEGDLGRRFGVPEVARSLAAIGIERPLTPLVTEALDADEARAFAGAGPSVTDDKPLLEHLAPRAFYENRAVDLPVWSNFANPGHLWRRLRPGGLRDDRELRDALAYTVEILPWRARREWLRELVRSGRGGEMEQNELRRLEALGR
ncbi:MAG: fused MFS/spermidine synthase [Candidatus Riflebacteria bacterium]|nr:fused MFS/spermidine synthase [Candidatus Riflebacteria bacterium]